MERARTAVCRHCGVLIFYVGPILGWCHVDEKCACFGGSPRPNPTYAEPREEE